MEHLTLEDFPEMDSLYRLVNIAARRAAQVSKPETRALVSTHAKKPIMIALDEIRDGKVGYRVGEEEEDELDIL
jgi:DNA-directed RNA polymerase omega subunit